MRANCNHVLQVHDEQLVRFAHAIDRIQRIHRLRPAPAGVQRHTDAVMSPTVDLREDLINRFLRMILKRPPRTVTVADVVDHRRKFPRRQPVYPTGEQRRPQLFHESKWRVDIVGLFRLKAARIARDRQVELRAEAFDLLQVILAIVMLPMAVRRPNIDRLEPRRRHVLHDRQKMLSRRGLDRRVVVGHPIRRPLIIQCPGDVIGADKADCSHCDILDDPDLPANRIIYYSRSVDA